MIVIDPAVIGAANAFTRASKACYWDSSFVLQEAAVNEFRMSFDPTNPELPALPLVETEAATNLFTYPREFGNSAWVKARSSVKENVALGPDGIMSADKLVEDVSTNSHLIFQDVNLTSGTKYALSVCAKSSERSSIRLDGSDSGVGVNNFSDFDLITKEVTISGNALAYMDDFGNGWLRCTCIFTAVSSVSTSFVVALRNASSNSYTGDGSSGLYIWHAQLEVGTEASSIIPPNTAFVSRASDKWEFNSSGVLTQYTSNVAVTAYDPVTLISRGLSLEAAATNGIRNNTMQGASTGPSTLPTNWSLFTALGGLNSSVVSFGLEGGIDYIDLRIYGTPSGPGGYYINFDNATTQAASNGQTWTASVFCSLVAGGLSGVTSVTECVSARLSGGGSITDYEVVFSPEATSLRSGRKSSTATFTSASTAFVTSFIHFTFSGSPVDITLRIGLPQLEQNSFASSPIKTSTVAVTRAADVSTSTVSTRAADVMPTGAGLLYSNVPITESAYNPATTYAQNDIVLGADGITRYESQQASNTGHALTETAWWLPDGVTNRWKMHDQYNNTQTEYADKIVCVLSPLAISQGIYLGNMVADNVAFYVTDLDEGLVYSEEQDTLTYNGGSSLFNWLFQRIQRKSYAISVLLPPYLNALVTVVINKPGATAKCGMCSVGPVADVGLSQFGLSREIKDYSTTKFNFDGTSSTVQRGFAKRMSVDVVIEQEAVDSTIEMLENYRQKNVVWVGDTARGHTIVFGKYSSFKNVIDSWPISKMALQIEGTV